MVYDSEKDHEGDYLREHGSTEEEANRKLSGDARQRAMVPKGKHFGIAKILAEDGKLKSLYRAKKSDWIHNMIHLDGVKFDFTGRKYLRDIYDTNYQKKLLKTGRQVEKCVPIWSSIILADGGRKAIKDVVPGDRVLAVDEADHVIEDIVLASESNGDRPCLRIKTLSGRVTEATYNHPLCLVDGWTQAADLKIGDGIACTHDSGGGLLGTKIIWDEIVSIEDIGIQPTWAIQTTTETYISDFVVQHNSTMLANELIINSVLRSYHKSLFVSPSHEQTRTFSNQKLRPWIEDSPLIAKYFQSTSVSNAVFERGFTNGSLAFLRSAFLNADRTRGVSADRLFLDEIQDVLVSNIPVIEETLSHSQFAEEIFSGTPKSLENPIQFYWELSSQNEWMVPCSHHTPQHWNFLDIKNIGKFGLICNKCGKPLDAQTGKWVAFSDKREWIGYRISQLMVPWFGNQKKWSSILNKLENYPTAQFYNEVLGISYDNASKPITREDLVACCSSNYFIKEYPDIFTRRLEIFFGVDWGEGTDGSERGEKGKTKPASYTVLTLGTYVSPGKFHYFFFKKFTGRDVAPSVCVPAIIAILKSFGIIAGGVDFGYGFGVNEMVEEAFPGGRVIKFQHVGRQRERKKYDELGNKYQLNRTEVMTDFFASIKRGDVIFPAWEFVKDALCDIEHIYAEYSPSSRQLCFDHKQTESDDFAHAMIFCREAADNYYGIKR